MGRRRGSARTAINAINHNKRNKRKKNYINFNNVVKLHLLKTDRIYHIQHCSGFSLCDTIDWSNAYVPFFHRVAIGAYNTLFSTDQIAILDVSMKINNLGVTKY